MELENSSILSNKNIEVPEDFNEKDDTNTRVHLTALPEKAFDLQDNNSPENQKPSDEMIQEEIQKEESENDETDEDQVHTEDVQDSTVRSFDKDTKEKVNIKEEKTDLFGHDYISEVDQIAKEINDMVDDITEEGDKTPTTSMDKKNIERQNLDVISMKERENRKEEELDQKVLQEDARGKIDRAATSEGKGQISKEITNGKNPMDLDVVSLHQLESSIPAKTKSKMKSKMKSKNSKTRGDSSSSSVVCPPPCVPGLSQQAVYPFSISQHTVQEKRDFLKGKNKSAMKKGDRNRFVMSVGAPPLYSSSRTNYKNKDTVAQTGSKQKYYQSSHASAPTYFTRPNSQIQQKPYFFNKRFQHNDNYDDDRDAIHEIELIDEEEGIEFSNKSQRSTKNFFNQVLNRLQPRTTKRYHVGFEDENNIETDTSETESPSISAFESTQAYFRHYRNHLTSNTDLLNNSKSKRKPSTSYYGSIGSDDAHNTEEDINSQTNDSVRNMGNSARRVFRGISQRWRDLTSSHYDDNLNEGRDNSDDHYSENGEEYKSENMTNGRNNRWGAGLQSSRKKAIRGGVRRETKVNRPSLSGLENGDGNSVSSENTEVDLDYELHKKRVADKRKKQGIFFFRNIDYPFIGLKNSHSSFTYSSKKPIFESRDLNSDDENSLGLDYPLPIDSDLDYNHDYIILPFGCGVWSKWQLKRFLLGVGIVAIFFACFGGILRYLLSMDVDKKRMSDAMSGSGNLPDSIVVDRKHKKKMRLETSQGPSDDGKLTDQQLASKNDKYLSSSFSSVWDSIVHPFLPNTNHSKIDVNSSSQNAGGNNGYRNIPFIPNFMPGGDASGKSKEDNGMSVISISNLNDSLDFSKVNQSGGFDYSQYYPSSDYSDYSPSTGGSIGVGPGAGQAFIPSSEGNTSTSGYIPDGMGPGLVNGSTYPQSAPSSIGQGTIPTPMGCLESVCTSEASNYGQDGASGYMDYPGSDGFHWLSLIVDGETTEDDTEKDLISPKTEIIQKSGTRTLSAIWRTGSSYTDGKYDSSSKKGKFGLVDCIQRTGNSEKDAMNCFLNASNTTKYNVFISTEDDPLCKACDKIEEDYSKRKAQIKRMHKGKHKRERHKKEKEAREILLLYQSCRQRYCQGQNITQVLLRDPQDIALYTCTTCKCGLNPSPYVLNNVTCSK